MAVELARGPRWRHAPREEEQLLAQHRVLEGVHLRLARARRRAAAARLAVRRLLLRFGLGLGPGLGLG